MAIYIALASGFISAVLLFYLLFGVWDEFADCAKFWFMPDIIGFLRGEWHEDKWAEMK